MRVIIAGDSVNISNKRVTTVSVRMPLIFSYQLSRYKHLNVSNPIVTEINFYQLFRNLLCEYYEPTNWHGDRPEIKSTCINIPKKIRARWLGARDKIITAITHLDQQNVNADILYHMLSPWLMVDTIITSNNWDKFFLLEIKPELKEAILDIENQIRKSSPVLVGTNQYHIPSLYKHEPSRDENRCILRFLADSMGININTEELSQRDVDLVLDIMSNPKNRYNVTAHNYTNHLFKTSKKSFSESDSAQYEEWHSYDDNLNHLFH